jgi:hypothetical protein
MVTFVALAHNANLRPCGICKQKQLNNVPLLKNSPDWNKLPCSVESGKTAEQGSTVALQKKLGRHFGVVLFNYVVQGVALHGYATHLAN